MNLIDEAIDAWKKNHEKLVIWGYKLLGGKVYKILQEAGISVEAIAVNRQYYDADSDNVVCLEDYLEDHVCSLIVAFKGYHKEMLSSLNQKNIQNVYTFDFQGRYAVNWDTKMTDSLLNSRKADLERLVSHLCDDLSKQALDEFIKQKRESFYYKEYSKDRQYFEHGIINIGEGECFVDCGGFDGDDTSYYLQKVESTSNRAIVFEPDVVNFNMIRNRFENDARVLIYQCGVSDVSSDLQFSSGKGTSSFVSLDGDSTVHAVTIDDVIKNTGLIPTFIKMDIEGYELKALIGAKESIRKCRPRLAVCVYHKAEDIFDLSKYILSIHNDYKLFFRSYHSASTEAVLYAI